MKHVVGEGAQQLTLQQLGNSTPSVPECLIFFQLQGFTSRLHWISDVTDILPS